MHIWRIDLYKFHLYIDRKDSVLLFRNISYTKKKKRMKKMWVWVASMLVQEWESLGISIRWRVQTACSKASLIWDWIHEPREKKVRQMKSAWSGIDTNNKAQDLLYIIERKKLNYPKNSKAWQRRLQKHFFSCHGFFARVECVFYLQPCKKIRRQKLTAKR